MLLPHRMQSRGLPHRLHPACLRHGGGGPPGLAGHALPAKPLNVQHRHPRPRDGLRPSQEESPSNLHTPAVGGSLLDELARDGARQMLAAELLAEVAAYVEAHRHEADQEGHRLVVRNGFHDPREVATTAGAVPVRQPRVNDKRIDEATGQRKRFASAILPAWAKKSPGVAEVLPLLYLHGLSSGDFVPALEQFLGSTAGLSPATVTRLTAQWHTGNGSTFDDYVTLLIHNKESSDKNSGAADTQGHAVLTCRACGCDSDGETGLRSGWAWCRPGGTLSRAPWDQHRNPASPICTRTRSLARSIRHRTTFCFAGCLTGPRGSDCIFYCS